MHEKQVTLGLCLKNTRAGIRQIIIVMHIIIFEKLRQFSKFHL